MKIVLSGLILSCAATSVMAAWYLDRDNTMVPADDLVGNSMVVVFSKNNKTIGTQVYCPRNPGTILGAAHGIVDNPATAVEQDRDHRTPAENLWGISDFPFSDSNFSDVSTDAQVISPRANLSADWNDPSTDYAFLTPDQPLHPDVEGVRILEATNLELVELAEVHDIFLYRAVTSYALNDDGGPDFANSRPDTRDVGVVYNHPQRVVEHCEIYEVSAGLTGTTCPVEQGVSGSPHITRTEELAYLVGVSISGKSAYLDTRVDRHVGGAFLNSAAFCSDYETVCGVSCAQIEDVVP